MITDNIVHALRNRYSDIHPLIFHRSVEKAQGDTDLFDILDTFPKEFPVVWHEEEKRWVATKDLLQIERFDFDVMGEK
jgi:hypothetical protein